jgi:hypothetical protein
MGYPLFVKIMFFFKEIGFPQIIYFIGIRSLHLEKWFLVDVE